MRSSPRIAIIFNFVPVGEMTESANPLGLRPFFGEMRRLGYVEGQNLVIERRSALGHPERFPEIAAEVVRLKPDVIVVGNNRIGSARPSPAPTGSSPAPTAAGSSKRRSRTTGDDCFGLHFGAVCNPKDLGPPTYVALNPPTIAVGSQNIGRDLRVFNEAATVSLVIEERFVYARHVLSDLSIEAPPPHNELGHSPTEIHESECGSVLGTLRARHRGA